MVGAQECGVSLCSFPIYSKKAQVSYTGNCFFFAEQAVECALRLSPKAWH